MKPADKLRDDGDNMPQYEREARVVTHQLRHDAAALLDECERVLADTREKLAGLINARGSEAEGTYGDWFGDIDATLAKLRGQA